VESATILRCPQIKRTGVVRVPFVEDGFAFVSRWDGCGSCVSPIEQNIGVDRAGHNRTVKNKTRKERGEL